MPRVHRFYKAHRQFTRDGQTPRLQGNRPAQEFIQQGADHTAVDDTFTAGNPEEDRLVLSTIHSAKGLEWHTVFIIWALDGRFPSSHALHKEGELEEELRLMYVAATRACQNLYFTYPNQVYDRSLGIVLYHPSRFIDMMPDDILEKRSAGRQSWC